MIANDLHYAMVIEWSDEDHVYIVTVPELPGCRPTATPIRRRSSKAWTPWKAGWRRTRRRVARSRCHMDGIWICPWLLPTMCNGLAGTLYRREVRTSSVLAGAADTS